MNVAPITPDHNAAILRLNAEFVDWLSPLDAAGLGELLKRADYARQIDDAQAVLIGFAHNSPGPPHANLDWLNEFLDDFFYIDRVIVSAEGQGKGHARRLYADLADYARAAGHNHLACEVSTHPPNPGSHAFHRALGFKPIGEHRDAATAKAVTYYSRAL